MKSADNHIFINVYLQQLGFVPAGVITFNNDLGYSGFSYFTSYIESNYPPLNPATLNWRDGTQRHFVINHKQNRQMLDKTFWELLPTQNDWGNQVLYSRYPEYGVMTNAQKLFFLGNRTVGGMNAFVKDNQLEENVNSIDWLDKVREESIEFYQHHIEKISYIKAITPLSSYGGVRPKCMFEDENGEFWIAKFNLPDDDYDMAIAEQIAMDMSYDSGLPTSKSKILTLPSGENVFLSKRFDRQGEHRFHSLSLFALAPHDVAQKNTFAGNSGQIVQTLIRRYSDFADSDTLHIVTKFLLDIGVNNTDNHLRNLRMILNEENKWQLAPMYDIVFNPYSQNHIYNPANMQLSELYLDNPKLINAMCATLGVKPHIVEERLKTVRGVVSNWESYCEKYKMKEEDREKIGKAVNLGLSRKDYSIERNIQITNVPVYKPNNI